MYRKEVNEQSPLRILEQSTHGGLGRGNLGVVMARAGVGKTAFLVHIALDDMMRERKIGFKCLTMDIDTTTSSGRLIYSIFAGLAEFEQIWPSI